MSFYHTLTVFAVSEGELQAQVEAAGKETVSGNVLIWFLCAIAFLKVSQKIDSFMSALGINVGHTGGSMLAEAMIAAKGIGSVRNFSSHYFGGGKSGHSSHVDSGSSAGSGFLAGGLAGVVSRSVTQSAVKSAVSPSSSAASGNSRTGGGLSGLAETAAAGIGGHLYSASVSKGGDFANDVIGTVAAGAISSTGSITGEKAEQALYSYMGYAELENGAEHVPSFPMWKSEAVVLPVRRFLKVIRKELPLVCTIRSNTQRRKVPILQFMLLTVLPGISSMLLIR